MNPHIICLQPTRDEKYVAVKVSVAEIHSKGQELKVLRSLAELSSGEPGSQHVMQLLDHFQVEGPNGKHECLVLEVLGPSISDIVQDRFGYGRLPGRLAKTSVRHALTGLAYLHEHDIGHGGTPGADLVRGEPYLHPIDLHTRNLAFAIPFLHDLSEAELFQKLGSPKIGAVTRKDGNPLEPGVPEYLVWSTSYPVDLSLPQQQIKIVDFGQSFSGKDIPETIRTPLCVRAPEVFFGEKLDYRVDLWSAGCLVSLYLHCISLSQVEERSINPFHRSSSSLLVNHLSITSW